MYINANKINSNSRGSLPWTLGSSQTRLSSQLTRRCIGTYPCWSRRLQDIRLALDPKKRKIIINNFEAEIINERRNENNFIYVHFLVLVVRQSAELSSVTQYAIFRKMAVRRERSALSIILVLLCLLSNYAATVKNINMFVTILTKRGEKLKLRSMEFDR